MNTQQLETVAQDTPCRPCGYNLRGLSPWGKCPECGGDIQHTLRAIRLGAVKQGRIEDIDSKIVNEWIEGLGGVLAWFMIDAIASFDLTGNRKVQLAVYIMAWSIGYLGMWKIGAGIKAFRACLIVGGLFPVVWGLESLPPQHWPGSELALLVPGILGSEILLQLRLASIARLIPSKAIATQFYFFVLLIPFAFCLAQLGFMFGGDITASLEMMKLLPSPAFGTALWAFEVYHRFGLSDQYIIYGLSALLAWPPILMLALLTKLLLRQNAIRKFASSALIATDISKSRGF
jgi:hypothetical protein